MNECFKNHDKVLSFIRSPTESLHAKQVAKKIMQFEQMGVPAGSASNLLVWVNSYLSTQNLQPNRSTFTAKIKTTRPHQ